MEDSDLRASPWEWASTKSIAVAAIIVSLTGLLLFRAIRGRRYRLPPGPKGWPLIGAIPYVGKCPHRSYYELSKEYGPVMYMRLGALPLVIISDAEMAREFYEKQDQEFGSRPPLLISNCISYGQQGLAFSPYGLRWRQARKIASSHLLTPSRLSQFMGNLKDEVLRTVHAALEQSQSESGNDVGVNPGVNMSALFNGVQMNMVTRLMWKKRHRNVKGGQTNLDHKFETLITEVMEILAMGNIADFLPQSVQSLAMKITGLDKRVENLHTQLDEYCETLIREREQGLSKDSAAAADDADFLDVMLKLSRQSGDSEGLSRDAIKAMLTDMLIVGTDTASVALDWLFIELIRHPEMMKRAQDELKAVVGEHRLVSETDLPNLKYLGAVVKEIFRHRGPAPFAVRYSMTDCKLGNYDVPAGTATFVSLFAIHHDPRVWEKPFKFNPDRFLESKLDYRGRDFEFLPFGSGRRSCPGMNLASAVIHMAAAQLLHTSTWSLPEGQIPEHLDMAERFGIVVSRADPLFLIAKPRLAHHVIYPPTT